MEEDKSQIVNIPPATVSPAPIKNNSFLVSLLSILLLLSVFIAGFFAYQTQNLVSEITKIKNVVTPTPMATSTPTSESTPLTTSLPTSTPTDTVACTMEAKICPDGTAVGRSGPKCEFAVCPTPKP